MICISCSHGRVIQPFLPIEHAASSIFALAFPDHRLDGSNKKEYRKYFSGLMVVYGKLKGVMTGDPGTEAIGSCGQKMKNKVAKGYSEGTLVTYDGHVSTAPAHLISPPHT